MKKKHGIPFETAAKVFLDENRIEIYDEMHSNINARKAKPCRGEPITLYVSSATLLKARNMREDYITILGKLLDKAVNEYPVV